MPPMDLQVAWIAASAALAGSVVGGLIGFLGQWWATRRQIKWDRQQRERDGLGSIVEVAAEIDYEHRQDLKYALNGDSAGLEVSRVDRPKTIARLRVLTVLFAPNFEVRVDAVARASQQFIGHGLALALHSYPEDRRAEAEVQVAENQSRVTVECSGLIREAGLLARGKLMDDPKVWSRGKVMGLAVLVGLLLLLAFFLGSLVGARPRPPESDSAQLGEPSSVPMDSQRGPASVTPAAVLRGTVLADPEPAATTVARSDEETGEAGAIPPTIYELQLGLYLREQDSVAFSLQLADLGYETHIVEVENSRGQKLYTVRLGQFESMEAAGAAMREFTAAEGMEAVIRFRPKPQWQ